MKSKWYTVTWQTRVGGLLVLLGFVPAFSFYAGMQFQALMDSNRAVGDLSAQNAILAPSENSTGLGNEAAPALPVSATYISPQQKFTFTLFKLPEQDRCVFTVNNDLGKAIDISRLVNVASIPCLITIRGLSSGFQKWLDESTFVIDVGGGKVLQINVLTMTAKAQ